MEKEKLFIVTYSEDGQFEFDTTIAGNSIDASNQIITRLKDLIVDDFDPDNIDEDDYFYQRFEDFFAFEINEVDGYLVKLERIQNEK